MDEYKNESSYEIRQRWVVSSFLPPPRNQNVEQEVQFNKFQIDECLGCEDRDWNVPEMLIEFCMVAEAAGVIPPMYEYYPIDPREHPYGKIQAGLFLVFQLLRKWAIDYKHSRIALKQVYEDKREFLDFWNKNKTIIYRLRPASKGSISCMPPSSGEIHDVLRKFAELLKTDIHLQQNCWPDLIIGLENYFREIDAYKSRYIESKSLEQLGLLLYRFCRSYLSRSKENAAGKKIHKIEKNLRELPVYPELSKLFYLPRCNKWDEEYLDAVGKLLQITSDSIADILNTEPQKSGSEIHFLTRQMPRPVSRMLNQVERAMHKMGISQTAIDKYIHETEKGSGRKCVAMLSLNNHHPVVAFSGYSDSNDPDVNKYLYSGSLYSDLLTLCKKYRMVFANLSPEVVNKIIRFDRKGIKHTMRYDLDKAVSDVYNSKSPTPTEESNMKVRNAIKTNYSCCERKILARLDVDRIFPVKATLHIKFSPCNICEVVLDYWTTAHGCKWVTGYLYNFK